MKGPNGPGQMSILDIRERELSSSLLDQIREKLRPGEGDEKQLPTLLLYDERGLKLFEDITYLPEYYLTNAEIEVLETHADRIAQVVLSGSQIIELGSGYAHHLPTQGGRNRSPASDGLAAFPTDAGWRSSPSC